MSFSLQQPGDMVSCIMNKWYKSICCVVTLYEFFGIGVDLCCSVDILEEVDRGLENEFLHVVSKPS